MVAAMIRRVTAGAVVVLLGLTVPVATGRAEEYAKPAAAAAPAPGAEPGKALQPRISKEAALARLKQYFAVPAETATLSMDANLAARKNQLTWEFQVNIRQESGGIGFGLASVDAMTGAILRYYGGGLPGPIRTGPLQGARPEAEARAKAWALVAEMYPTAAPALQPVPPELTDTFRGYFGYSINSGAADTYRFNWMFYQNGVPYPNGLVGVDIDKVTLAYTGLQANLPEGISFPPAAAKVKPEQAMAMWTTGEEPQLIYQPLMPKLPYGARKPAAYRLVYQFENAARVVDALTGKFVPENVPQPLSAAPLSGTAEPVPTGDGKAFVPALPLTEADALTLAANLLGLSDVNAIRPTIGAFGDEDVIQLWAQSGGINSNIAISRETGLIQHANRSQMGGGPAAPGPEKPTPEQEAQAKQAAFGVVQQYYSTAREQLRLMPNTNAYYGPQKDPLVRSYLFRRFVDGIPVANDSVSVSIDLRTMTWRDISANWTSGVTFPDGKKAISALQAATVFYSGRKPVRVYQPVTPPAAPDMSYGDLPQVTEAALVYMLSGQQEATMVDALTGEPVTWDGQTPGALPAALDRVQGHWAEGELRYMLAQQAILPGALNPDAPVTRAQAVQMLLLREQRWSYSDGPVTLPYQDVKRGDPAYAFVAAGYGEGWLSPVESDGLFRPEQPVTRAQFAVWAARALGLGALARSELSVTPAFTDLAGLTPEERNAANFLRALGLLAPAERFRGQDFLTQAEAAALTARIYNSLLK